jgi:hypothetical protein
MGLGFTGLGAYVVLEGLKAYGDPLMRTVDPSTNPGSTTTVIGGLLTVLGLAISFFGWKGSGGHPLSVLARSIPAGLRSPRFFKGGLVLALIAIYFFVLWRALPFWLSTSLFLAASMWTFKAGAWWKILLVTAIATALIWYIFAVLAIVPLPDDFFWQAAARAPRR